MWIDSEEEIGRSLMTLFATRTIEGIEDALEELEINEGEVGAVDVGLVRCRGKHRITLQDAVGLDLDHVWEFIEENIEPLIDKRRATSGGVKIGHIYVDSDGTCVGFDIEEQYRNRSAE